MKLFVASIKKKKFECQNKEKIRLLIYILDPHMRQKRCGSRRFFPFRAPQERWRVCGSHLFQCTDKIGFDTDAHRRAHSHSYISELNMRHAVPSEKKRKNKLNI